MLSRKEIIKNNDKTCQKHCKNGNKIVNACGGAMRTGIDDNKVRETNSWDKATACG